MVRSMILMAALVAAANFALADDEKPKESDPPREGLSDESQKDRPRDGERGRGDSEERFKRHDKNNDGKISLDEIPEEGRKFWERVIENADKDGDKAVTKEELRAGFEKWRESRGGRGEGPEGRGGRGGRGPGGRGPGGWEGPNPEKMFERLDKNSDGKVTAEEISEQGRERMQKMFSKADKDGDKALSKEEFSEGMKAAAEHFREMAQKRGEYRPGRERPEGGPRDGGRDFGDDRPPREGRGGPGRHGPRGPHGPHGGPPDPERAASQMLKRLDKDNDGKLTEQEFSEGAKKRFEKLDSNRDGSVDRAEIEQKVKSKHEKHEKHRGDRDRGRDHDDDDDDHPRRKRGGGDD